MHVALVFPCMPHPSSNGWGMISWSITKSLLEVGHNITIYSLLSPDEQIEASKRQAAIQELGLIPIVVPVNGYGLPRLFRDSRSFINKFDQFVHPSMSSFFPNTVLASHMNQLLEKTAPDAILAFHYDALAATFGLRIAPRLALTADIWHWPSFYGWRGQRPRPTPNYLLSTLETIRNLIWVPRFMVKLANDCEACMCFGAFDAEWLRKHGARRARLVRPPIENAINTGWEVRGGLDQPRRKPKILIGLSNLEALATREAVRFFAKEILPRLERELGSEGFEVHVLGEGKPPSELTKMLPRVSVLIRGRIEPVDSELLSSDIVLIPTPIIFALRNRIIYAFSLGCCVVAHTNEAKNIPEMVNEDNALLASEGRSLTDAIIRAIRDPELRKRLGFNARRTYERYFAPGIATAPIVSTLGQIVEEWKESHDEP